jgi:3-methyladenine DNA glycosylase Mpg
MDYGKFFGRKADVVAKDLLGRLLVRKTGEGAIGGQILETGAYEGGKQTPSRSGMNYAPGSIFLMPSRRSQLFNIASGKEGKPSCVEIRALSFHDGIIEGPGRISNYLNLGPEFDGVLLGKELQIRGERVSRSRITRSLGSPDNCIGYFSIKKE